MKCCLPAATEDHSREWEGRQERLGGKNGELHRGDTTGCLWSCWACIHKSCCVLPMPPLEFVNIYTHASKWRYIHSLTFDSSSHRKIWKVPWWTTWREAPLFQVLQREATVQLPLRVLVNLIEGNCTEKQLFQQCILTLLLPVLFCKLTWLPCNGHHSSQSDVVYSGSTFFLGWLGRSLSWNLILSSDYIEVVCKQQHGFTGLLSHRPRQDVFSEKTRKVFIHTCILHTSTWHDSIAHPHAGFADCLYSRSVVTSIWVYSSVWKMGFSNLFLKGLHSDIFLQVHLNRFLEVVYLQFRSWWQVFSVMLMRELFTS